MDDLRDENEFVLACDVPNYYPVPFREIEKLVHERPFPPDYQWDKSPGSYAGFVYRSELPADWPVEPPDNGGDDA